MERVGAFEALALFRISSVFNAGRQIGECFAFENEGLVGVPDKDVADGELFGLDGDLFFTGQLNQFVFANVDGDGRGCDCI